MESVLDKTEHDVFALLSSRTSGEYVPIRQVVMNALEKIEKHEVYMGKRVKRGLFQSSVCKLINADVNGALNIARKVFGDSGLIPQIINRGLLYNPVKFNSVVELHY